MEELEEEQAGVADLQLDGEQLLDFFLLFFLFLSPSKFGVAKSELSSLTWLMTTEFSTLFCMLALTVGTPTKTNIPIMTAERATKIFFMTVLIC